MRYTGPKARLCRREGINLFGTEKYDKILNRRPGKPGQIGKGMAKKQSGYCKQLREKQKLKTIFGLTEKQLEKIFVHAKNQGGITSLNLLKNLELRLDNVIYRAGFARTRMQARQMANHGLFTMNGRRIDVPSATVKVGDKIEVRDRVKKSPLFEGFKELKSDISPTWLSVDKSKMVVEVKDAPQDDEVEQIIDSALVVEFYSR